MSTPCSNPNTPAPDAFLKIRHLSKAYRETRDEHEVTHQVLADMSVTIPPAEVTAILGKSGTGKTTLLNLISGIDLPDQGQIVLNGCDLSALNDHARTLFRRRNIGFVFQFYNLIPTLTVWENLALPLELNGMTASADYDRARGLLAHVELLDHQKAYPDQLSGGEQQRVAIARALVHNPMLVLADEPTGNLDEERSRQIMEMLDQLTRQAGKNLILVTHSAVDAGIADTVYRLHDGRLMLNE
ncbi:MAG: ABC transporter ATP-binding protein [Anaerolineaceae bacterium]